MMEDVAEIAGKLTKAQRERRYRQAMLKTIDAGELDKRLLAMGAVPREVAGRS